MGSSYVVVVLGAHVRVFIPSKVVTRMQTLHEHQWCYFWQKLIFFDVLVNMSLILTPTINFYICTLFDFEGILYRYVARDMGQFAYPNSKVASSLWFACFGLRICGGAQQLDCFHLVDRTSIPLIF